MLLTETTETNRVDWSIQLQGQLRNQFGKGLSNATPDELFRPSAASFMFRYQINSVVSRDIGIDTAHPGF